MTKDVFDDTEEVETEETAADTEVEAEESEDTEESTEAEESEGEEESETPADETTKSEKFIPESRFKAALANVSKELDDTKTRLAQYETVKAPSKEEDPEGHTIYMKTVMSARIMQKAYPDYDAKIEHFKKMTEANPYLNSVVANSEIPAETAYKLAEEDLEVAKLKEVSKSDDWKQFQQWKKEQLKLAKQNPEAGKKVDEKLKKALAVPNLTKTISVSKRSSGKDDDVFAGSAF